MVSGKTLAAGLWSEYPLPAPRGSLNQQPPDAKTANPKWRCPVKHFAEANCQVHATGEQAFESIHFEIRS